jgi:predicted metal-dependent enzyme (double-stranded beta helix superfamily)
MLSVQDFAAEVARRCAGDLDAKRLGEWLRETRVEPASLEAHVRFEPGRYTRHLIFKNADVEVLVLCWPSGVRAPVHGHEGELCWARVERGRLRFTSYRELSRMPLRLEPQRSLDGGPGHLDGPADIHAVANEPEFGADAVTVHVYARPYDECDIYDVEAGVVQRVRLRYDSEPAPARRTLRGKSQSGSPRSVDEQRWQDPQRFA